MTEQQTELANTPANLLKIALEGDADLEKLEKLMELQERWEKKEAAKAFKKAMACFQSKKPVLVKDQSAEFNGKKQYDYISLSSIQKAIDGPLSECGLSYRWEQEDAEKSIKITCVVSHFDGHEERTWLKAPADTSGSKNTIQSIGSTVSYLKRYSLEGALGLSSYKDDDGNSHKDPKDPNGTLKLPRMNEKQYKATMSKVNKGEVTLQKVQESFELTTEQKNALKALEESKPKK